MKIETFSSPFWFAIHEGYETKTSFRANDQRSFHGYDRRDMRTGDIVPKELR